MALPELIKNFNRIRDCMKEFYVNGFKTRDEIAKKSERTFEYEKKRIENWLDGYMGFNYTADGKASFISIDSREEQHNPLYRAWKTKSFTDCDISLHFILFDIFHSPDIELTFKKLHSEITNKSSEFIPNDKKLNDNYYIGLKNSVNFEESNLRKKLKEYVGEGLLLSRKDGNTVYYRRSPDVEMCDSNALDFFSEVAPCGVVGSFLLDKTDKHKDFFTFKHHYITATLDSEILYNLLLAIRNKNNVQITVSSVQYPEPVEHTIVPLKIYISVQNGRQYVMAYSVSNNGIFPFRIDNIKTVKILGQCSEYDSHITELERIKTSIWGVQTFNKSGRNTEHVEFTVRFEDNEQYILSRLEREKRCGKVELIDSNTAKFSADVYDTWELVPWIRTFIGRITDLYFSNQNYQSKFIDDIKKMYEGYTSEGGED